jgi:hypothetical protein
LIEGDIFMLKEVADERYPAWIKNHRAFKNTKKIDKIFPTIGLPNCEKEAEIDNASEIIASARLLAADIRGRIETRIESLRRFPSNAKKKLSDERTLLHKNIIHLMRNVRNQISEKNLHNTITNKNGRISLNLQKDIFEEDEKKAVFKAGESLFRVYNKLNEKLLEGKFVQLEKIENFYSFKEFSRKNIPASKHKIVFSSVDKEGIWDIATMSMRGITTCQTWGGENSSHIIGSMADPFTGIIYLTSGGNFNNYGSKMIRRCVVRFIVNKKTGIPLIGLERMYPDYNENVLNSFIEFIKEKTENKLEVLYLFSGKVTPSNFKVPLSKKIFKLERKNYPYVDSSVSYQATDPITDDSLSRKVTDNVFMSIKSIKKTETPPNVYAVSNIKNLVPVESYDEKFAEKINKFIGNYKGKLKVRSESVVKKGIEAVIFSALYPAIKTTDAIKENLEKFSSLVAEKSTPRVIKMLNIQADQFNKNQLKKTDKDSFDYSKFLD